MLLEDLSSELVGIEVDDASVLVDKVEMTGGLNLKEVDGEEEE